VARGSASIDGRLLDDEEENKLIFLAGERRFPAGADEGREVDVTDELRGFKGEVRIDFLGEVMLFFGEDVGILEGECVVDGFENVDSS